MSYPPGMTKRDWEHTEGRPHHPQCPLGEEWECSDEDAARIDPYEVKELVHSAESAAGGYVHVGSRLRKALAPFQWMLDCHCAEIVREERESALLASHGL